jgi:hypothetical protein
VCAEAAPEEDDAFASFISSFLGAGGNDLPSSSNGSNVSEDTTDDEPSLASLLGDDFPEFQGL